MISLISSLASALSLTFLGDFIYLFFIIIYLFSPSVVEKWKILLIFSTSTVHSGNYFRVELREIRLVKSSCLLQNQILPPVFMQTRITCFSQSPNAFSIGSPISLCSEDNLGSPVWGSWILESYKILLPDLVLQHLISLSCGVHGLFNPSAGNTAWSRAGNVVHPSNGPKNPTWAGLVCQSSLQCRLLSDSTCSHKHKMYTVEKFFQLKKKNSPGKSALDFKIPTKKPPGIWKMSWQSHVFGKLVMQNSCVSQHQAGDQLVEWWLFMCWNMVSLCKWQKANLCLQS